MWFDYLSVSQRSKNNARTFHLAARKWKALRAYHGTRPPSPPMALFYCSCFCVWLLFISLKYIPSLSFRNWYFLKSSASKMSNIMKNENHKREGCSQPLPWGSLMFLGHHADSPCVRNNTHSTLSRQPLVTGSAWSPDKQSGPFPWRQCGICSDICHPIHQSGPQRRSPFKVEDKEKSSFGKTVKKGPLFLSFRGRVDEGHTWREFGWIWWRPSEGGRD